MDGPSWITGKYFFLALFPVKHKCLAAMSNQQYLLVQIKQMSEQELARLWSTYVKELAVLLVSVEGNDDPAPDVMRRIKDLVQTELLSLYIRSVLGDR